MSVREAPEFCKSDAPQSASRRDDERMELSVTTGSVNQPRAIDTIQ